MGRESVRVRGVSLPLYDGYCAATDDVPAQRGNRSCGRVGVASAQGFWKRMGDPFVPHTLSDCVRRCLACAACNFVSFSESHFQRECSWYASCPRYERDALEEKQSKARRRNGGIDGDGLERIGSELCPTFSTVRVRPALA